MERHAISNLDAGVAVVRPVGTSQACYIVAEVARHMMEVLGWPMPILMRSRKLGRMLLSFKRILLLLNRLQGNRGV